MNYELAEKEIRDRLLKYSGSPAVTTKPSNYTIEILAENEESFKRPQGNEVIIGVVYKGSHFEEPDSMDYIEHLESMDFEINIQCKKRTGANGVYAAVEYVRQRLLGFQCKYFRRMRFQDLSFLDFEDNLWQYAVFFRAETRVTQDEDENNYNKFTRITAGTVVVPEQT
jgi:hypothetical protein